MPYDPDKPLPPAPIGKTEPWAMNEGELEAESAMLREWLAELRERIPLPGEEDAGEAEWDAYNLRFEPFQSERDALIRRMDELTRMRDRRRLERLESIVHVLIFDGTQGETARRIAAELKRQRTTATAGAWLDAEVQKYSTTRAAA